MLDSPVILNIPFTTSAVINESEVKFLSAFAAYSNSAQSKQAVIHEDILTFAYCMIYKLGSFYNSEIGISHKSQEENSAID